MSVTLAVSVAVAAVVLVVRWRRPVWYWLGVGGVVAAVRVRSRWASVMEACELVVAPSRARRALARVAGRPVPAPLVPRLARLRVSRAGLVLRVALRPGQDAFDFAAASDRLRHSFGMQQVVAREVRAGVIELRMTGYDVLRRVQMPRMGLSVGLRVPVALEQDGSVWWRDFRRVPHRLTVGAIGSGKSVSQRRLVEVLAPVPGLALVGIDCKQGIELGPLARRFSALVGTPADALGLLDALIARMEGIYRLIRAEQRISAGIPDGEITADIWGLGAGARPVAVVVLIDEIAELALVSSGSKEEEARRDRIVTALVRLAQLGRAAGIYLEVYGQRFGADLGKGITTLRAQLTGRSVHRVNDEGSAKMALGDIAPDAVTAAIQISADRPGMAVVTRAAGSWTLVRTPPTSMRGAVDACSRFAHLTPDIPELARWRPAESGVSLVTSRPSPVAKAA